MTDAAGVTRIIGQARTSGPRDAITAADPIEPARAARRALADAGCKAVEVDLLIIAARDEPTPVACATLARRALGPHGLETRTVGMAVATDKADELVADAVSSLAASQDTAWTLAVAIGAGSDGTIVALCVRRDDH